MTRIVHCKKEKYDVYIGRGSIWGNPFRIGVDGTREEVVHKYLDWILDQPNLMKQMHTLRDKVLGCWCAPKICHGDALVIVLEELDNTQ